MTVDVTEVLSLARDLTRRLRALIGLPEMVVKATGGLLDRFPVFFAEPTPAPARACGGPPPPTLA